jgi:mono/diheme cytochrome c family protein
MKPLVMPVGALALLVSSFAQSPKEEDQPARLINSLQGAELYNAYCAVCHGSDAKGNGPMSKSLRTAPSDLTRIAARNGGSFPVARVRNVISGDEALGAGRSDQLTAHVQAMRNGGRQRSLELEGSSLNVPSRRLSPSSRC